MKQLIQNFKTGELSVIDIDPPELGRGMVLVANRYSVISAGTEKTTVSTGKASLFEKARKRPDLVRQVLDNLRKEGFASTIEKVKTKLDSIKSLGYSCAGVVLASTDTQSAFLPGDRVACAGADYASHAEMVAVPQNLVVKVPDQVSFEDAAFTTIGSIAMQGVRQANPSIGDSISVIGLGLIGQITIQILRAHGCRVFGIDTSEATVTHVRKMNWAEAVLRQDPTLLSAAQSFTRGRGFDSVIITAGAPTSDPVELASELLRKRGRMVVVGAVKMDIPRDPFFYRKELELRMSCSYGPGRYDRAYEEEGIDYPYAYVRWTEQRNMESFLDLIATGSISLNCLVTHVFDIQDAIKAYDIVLGKVQERYLGILLRYCAEGVVPLKPVIQQTHFSAGAKGIGFIGAGSFAQSNLIPACARSGMLTTVITRTGVNAANVAEKFGFKNHGTDASKLLADPDISMVFIATQHDTHARLTCDALHAGKNVFVEKPMALSYEELEVVKKECMGNASARLVVGYNRRFAPLSIHGRHAFAGVKEPLCMTMRINAGFIPHDHWIQTAAGGGRILGEVCHWVDLMQFLCAADPVKVYAACIHNDNSAIKNADNVTISITFSNGSIGTLVYLANGDKRLPKEHIEISGGGISYSIDDFKTGSLFAQNKRTDFKTGGKGHKEEVEAFINAVRDGTPSPISFESLYLTSLTTLKILDSLAIGLPLEIIKA